MAVLLHGSEHKSFLTRRVAFIHFGVAVLDGALCTHVLANNISQLWHKHCHGMEQYLDIVSESDNDHSILFENGWFKSNLY